MHTAKMNVPGCMCMHTHPSPLAPLPSAPLPAQRLNFWGGRTLNDVERADVDVEEASW